MRRDSDEQFGVDDDGKMVGSLVREGESGPLVMIACDLAVDEQAIERPDRLPGGKSQGRPPTNAGDALKPRLA